MKKIVFWGHKLHSGTHSYSTNGYYRAFKVLGWETHWIDATDNLDDIDFSNSIFYVEHSASDGMPIRKDCKYITHSFPAGYLESNGVPSESILNLGNYTIMAEEYEKINDVTYWDSSTRTLYQPWATNLLPNEIDIDNPISFDDQIKRLNYVGMFCDKELWWWAEEFATQVANNHGVEFKLFTSSVSDGEAQNLIQKSFLCPDFRNDWHLQCGYIPCRIWKNISYGRIAGTNSPLIKRIFGDYVVYGGTPQTLYENLLKSEIDKTVNMKEAMLFVKDNHTFINRIENLLKFI